MNDSEIIKAYEEEISKPQNHYIGTVGILWNVLDLIKRQQAEIDTMKDAMAKLLNTLERANKYGLGADERIEQLKIELEKAKSTAVREFAEKLKEKLKANSNYGDIYDVVAYDCIDNLVKEMGCDDG